MILPVAFDPQAQDDLTSLEDYLANRFSSYNAAVYVRRITETCLSLGIAPYRGMQRNDIRPGLRTIGFEGRITITYTVTANIVVVLGVYYGGREPR